MNPSTPRELVEHVTSISGREAAEIERIEQRKSALRLPQSPLAAYRSQGPLLRTAYTHSFRRTAGITRAIASAFRLSCRAGSHTSHTSGCASGFVQANFVALPRVHAFDFLKFCLQNARSCPLLEVTEPGDPFPKTVASGADLRTDIPKYRIWRHGELAEEVSDIRRFWDDEMVGFLLGCSFTWEGLLEQHGLTPRHIEQRVNVSMYKTKLRNESSGPFSGNLVVSMRPYLPSQLETVDAITSRFPAAHGGPIHWGEPTELGLTYEQLAQPDWGDAVDMRSEEVPVFWACGVTPQSALQEARLDLAITHAPGYMFITDLLDSELEVRL